MAAAGDSREWQLQPAHLPACLDCCLGGQQCFSAEISRYRCKPGHRWWARGGSSNPFRVVQHQHKQCAHSASCRCTHRGRPLAPERVGGLGKLAGLLPGAQLVLQRKALGLLPAAEAQLAHSQHCSAKWQRPRLVSGRRLTETLRATLQPYDKA